MPIEQWAKRLKLNPTSPTTQQLYNNRFLTVAEYVTKFRRGGLNEVLPSEAKVMSVEEALEKQSVGGRNMRKLLVSGREKFKK